MLKTNDRPKRALGARGSESSDARFKLSTKCSPLLQRCFPMGAVDSLLTEPALFALPHEVSRQTAVSQLLDLLKIAAAVRVAITYGGVLNNELQLWGFPVAGRVSNGNGSREEEPVVIEV